MEAKDLRKIYVVDDVLGVTALPVALITQGPLQSTSQPQRATTFTAATTGFATLVSTYDTVVDRTILYSAGLCVQFVVTHTVDATSTTDDFYNFGEHYSVAPYPLNRSIASAQVTVNNVSLTSPVADYIDELTAVLPRPQWPICASMPPVYADNNSSWGTQYDTMAAYGSLSAGKQVPNGSFGIAYYQPDGTTAVPLVGAFAYTTGTGPSAITTNFLDGVPYFPKATVGAQSIQLYVRITSTEPLMASPFAFMPGDSQSPGMYRIGQIQIVLNHSPPSTSRVLQFRTLRPQQSPNSFVPSAVQFCSIPWISPSVYLKQLSLQYSSTLPTSSAVPSYQIQRFMTQGPQTQQPPALPWSPIPSNGRAFSITSQSLNLSSMPDEFLVSVRAQAPDYNDASGRFVAVTGVSVLMHNQPGCLSSFNAEQLYMLSRANGSEQSYQEFIGLAFTSQQTWDATIGPVLVLKAKDLNLPADVAPGVQGSFLFQLKIDCVYWGKSAILPQLNINTVSSGYLINEGGRSRTLMSLITPADVLEAAGQVPTTISALERDSGSESWGSSVTPAASRMKRPPPGSGASDPMDMESTPLARRLLMEGGAQSGGVLTGGIMSGGFGGSGGRGQRRY